MTESPLAARIVLGIVAMMAISIPIGITMKTKAEIDLLERTAQVTNGRVTGTTCSSHGMIHFSYLAGGTQYENSQQSCDLFCESAKPGDKLWVIYSSERPQLSRCVSLESSKNNLTGTIICIVVAGLMMVYGIFRMTKFDKPSD